MEGYKAFDKNLKCRGMQYEIGKEYELGETPIPCQRGYHFCKTVADCYGFYDRTEETRICKVEAYGEVKTDDEVKYCTDKIRILEEVEDPRKASNTSESSSGYRNSGDRNSGYRNSGDWNSGYRNSGDWNSGDWNSGDWNSGDWNSGIFCTEKDPKIKIFDIESSWTMRQWKMSKANDVMSQCPSSYAMFISQSEMESEEKENHPEYKTIGGYLKKVIVTKEEKQRWWDELPEDNKAAVYALPNFDADKFEKCTGIKVEEAAGGKETKKRGN